MITAALAVTVGFSAMYITGSGYIVTGALNALCVPFRWCFTKICDGFEGYGRYFSGMNELIEENEKLKEENRELEERLLDEGYARDENTALRGYLEIKELNPDIKMLDATVVSGSSESYLTVFRLNRGSRDGVKKGMPVISRDGVIGYVSAVESFSCKVSTLLDLRSSVGVYVERSGACGIIGGDISRAENGGLVVRYIDADADIKPGDTVMTSGLGGVFPRGLTIGTVLGVNVDNYLHMLSVTVEPSADLMNIGKVMIITDFDVYTPEATETGAQTSPPAEAEG